jgi:hypothetical protein
VLEQRGDRTAIDLLSEVANSQLVDMNLRIQAMGMLASYQSGKRPAYRYVQDEQKPNPNPWANVPDVGSAVDVAPKRRGRPRKRPEPETGPEPPTSPKTDPEPEPS